MPLGRARFSTGLATAIPAAASATRAVEDFIVQLDGRVKGGFEGQTDGIL